MTQNQSDIKFSMLHEMEATFKSLVDAHADCSFYVLTDSGSRRHCLPKIKSFLPANAVYINIAQGEEHKSLESAEKIWSILTAKKADRKSILLNLGGGMIGDLGGFCASTYKRGIDFIQMPTTLLAMVDASLGGKTGLNFAGNKNQIGTFQQPLDVWIFPDFLQTLPEKELLSGFAEVIKHSLIADVNAWHLLRKRDLRNQSWPQRIEESLQVKKAIVEIDPFEQNERKKLNAGHTMGHALESLLMAQKNPMPHGHCIAAGLVMEGFISLEMGLMTEFELIQIEELVYSIYGILPLKKSDKKSLWNWAMQDKKNQNSEVRMALVGPIGNCQVNIPVSQDAFNRAVDYYLG